VGVVLHRTEGTVSTGTVPYGSIHPRGNKRLYKCTRSDGSSGTRELPVGQTRDLQLGREGERAATGYGIISDRRYPLPYCRSLERYPRASVRKSIEQLPALL
jgi:hypothetical protein